MTYLTKSTWWLLISTLHTWEDTVSDMHLIWWIIINILEISSEWHRELFSISWRQIQFQAKYIFDNYGLTEYENVPTFDSCQYNMVPSNSFYSYRLGLFRYNNDIITCFANTSIRIISYLSLVNVTYRSILMWNNRPFVFDRSRWRYKLVS